MEGRAVGSACHFKASLENGVGPAVAARSGAGRTRPHHIPPRPTGKELMETLMLPPRPSASQEAPGSHWGFFPLSPQIVYSRKSCSKKLSCNISRVFPLWPRQKYCKEQPCSGKDECCLVVRAQGSWSGAVGSHSSFATESF